MAGARTSLATRLQGPGLVTAAGVFDALSAVLAQRAGCEAVFLSGSALAGTQLGRPDVGLLTATELADVVCRICDRVEIPVLVDADHGFGSAINVYRTVRLLERAGASAIQLEDRREATPPEEIHRRPLVDAALMAAKIRAAADARASALTVISARTDALHGSTMDDALDRAECYIEAGADMIFVEGCATPDTRRQIADRLSGRVPLLFNAGILGPESLPCREEFERLGYSMVLFPGDLAAAAARAMQLALADIRVWAGDASPGGTVDLQTAIGADAFMAEFS